ncbi:hypothetical protein RRG08_063635 [Elysia crispata]|uniref:Uncharacterized protein n=1 Tax=Elysia crispata TaxID=231223 RepID=A0AAE1DZK7_9GAST|nr:hypothetical protein RRG08_063635 [Elysia crispata]
MGVGNRSSTVAVHLVVLVTSDRLTSNQPCSTFFSETPKSWNFLENQEDRQKLRKRTKSRWSISLFNQYVVFTENNRFCERIRIVHITESTAVSEVNYLNL